MVESNEVTEKGVIECIQICCDDIEDSRLRGEANLINDLKYDSLKYFELIDILERRFNISIDERDFCKLSTVCEVVLYLKRITNN